jgi:acetyl/propionyl-CoA carboxylase alpha subunit
VSVYYDPMLAKLIVAAESRAAAIARAVAALRRYVVLGIRTNIPYLLMILQHPRFLSGDVDTGFLATERDALLEMLAKTDVPLSALAAAAFHSQRPTPAVTSAGPTHEPSDPFATISGWGLS